MNQIAYKFVSWDVPALESLATWKNDKIMRKYKLFIGYRLLGEFSGIWEAKNFAAESGMSGIFSLVGENYRDSWYEPKKQDKNGNKD